MTCAQNVIVTLKNRKALSLDDHSLVTVLPSISPVAIIPFTDVVFTLANTPFTDVLRIRLDRERVGDVSSSGELSSLLPAVSIRFLDKVEEKS
jgi:hypothetical protein